MEQRNESGTETGDIFTPKRRRRTKNRKNKDGSEFEDE
jgi:hypothetical protein